MTFVETIAPLAMREQRRSGISAALTIAQAIVESASGTSPLAVNGHNYFGIKWVEGCGWPFQEKLTKEWVGGRYIDVVARFRKYPSMDAGFRDHSAFLHKDRYKDVWGAGGMQACVEIREAGYATSPTYITTLQTKITELNLLRYEQMAGKPKVFLSPSSQDANRYASGNTTEEIVCNAISAKVGIILVSHGVLVAFNNPAELPSGHVARGNAFNPDLWICMHTNAGGARGMEAFCYNPADPSNLGTRVAKNVYARISAKTPTGDRGVKQNRSFTEIIKAKAPVAYFEYDFHDSVEGANWLLANSDLLALETAQGILEELGIKYTGATRRVRVTATSLRIRSKPSLFGAQVGSYLKGDIAPVFEEQAGWGRTDKGWISLKYTVGVA